jgi:acetylornithine deacetylase/succinyl-diaminopimelate desuccinylase-like protein
MPRTLRPSRASRRLRATALVAGVCALAVAPAAAQGPRTPHDSLARDVLRELIGINTAPSAAQESAGALAVAQRLRDAGFAERDVAVIGPTPRFRNVVATLRGRDTAAAPILLMAHLDVVEAKREDWSFDPFTFREEDGWYYGRGAADNKAGVATLVANFIRWKREGWVPARDVVLVLTCDEETTAEHGMIWLLANVPRLRTAAFALNTDGGGVSLADDGTPRLHRIQSSEKMYVTYRLEVRNPGGHSSLPRKDNAIYSLARALSRLAAYQFPVRYDAVTRTAFQRMAALERGQLAQDLAAAGRGATTGPAIARLSGDPSYNGNLRTTCVATMLEGGHAENALPQLAAATVNCRVFPGVPADSVEATLRRVVADTTVRIVQTYAPVPSPASPVRRDVFATVERLTRAFWPTATVIPYMENGATDGLYLRNVGVPVYGIAALRDDPSGTRAHGRDERVSAKAFFESTDFWYRMVGELASQPMLLP